MFNFASYTNYFNILILKFLMIMNINVSKSYSLLRGYIRENIHIYWDAVGYDSNVFNWSDQRIGLLEKLTCMWLNTPQTRIYLMKCSGNLSRKKDVHRLALWNTRTTHICRLSKLEQGEITYLVQAYNILAGFDLAALRSWVKYPNH